MTAESISALQLVCGASCIACSHRTIRDRPGSRRRVDGAASPKCPQVPARCKGPTCDGGRCKGGWRRACRAATALLHYRRGGLFVRFPPDTSPGTFEGHPPGPLAPLPLLPAPPCPPDRPPALPPVVLPLLLFAMMCPSFELMSGADRHSVAEREHGLSPTFSQRAAGPLLVKPITSNGPGHYRDPSLRAPVGTPV